MNEIKAAEALAELLETMEDRPPTIYEANEIPAHKPFLIVEMIPIDSRSVGLSYQVETAGTMQVTIVTDGGDSLTQSEAIARRVAAVFPAGTVYKGVRITHPPFLEKGYPDNGVWRLPLKIRWRVLPG